MPLTSNPEVAAANAARREREKLKPEDINSDWFDREEKWTSLGVC